MSWAFWGEVLRLVAFLLLSGALWAQGRQIRALEEKLKRIHENLLVARDAADRLNKTMEERR